MMLGKPCLNSSPIVLFGNPPDYDSLCAIGLSISSLSVNPSSRNQAQILKCRELIFTEPDIIATPGFNDSHRITLILQKSVHQTGRLHARLQKIGLQVSPPNDVTPALYQACLMYTLLAKLAPSWNKAGQWLLQGRDFLTNTVISAIKMCLNVSYQDVTMALEATSIRTSAYKLSDLNLCNTIQSHFLKEPEDVISESHLMNTWCHVLPSMKKGKVVSVSKTIPEDSPLKTYRDFKRHWKNTYGYRLPELEDNILYYQIHFRPIGNTLFTYPDVCLRPREFHCLPRVDPKPILACFLQDVRAKMPAVCGQNLTFQPRVKYLKPGLCLSSQDLNQVNLTSKLSQPNFMARNPTILQNICHGTSAVRKEGKQDRLQQGSAQIPQNLTLYSSSQIQEQNNKPGKQSHLNSHGKVIPVFKSNLSSAPVNVKKSVFSVHKITPVFQLRKMISGNLNSNQPSSTTSSHQQEPVDRMEVIADSYVKSSFSWPGKLVEEKQTKPATPLFERQLKRPVPLSSSDSNNYKKLCTGKGVNLPEIIEDEDFQLPQPMSQIGLAGTFVEVSNPAVPAKRSAKTVDLPAAKKSRVKTQVQSNMDVELMAKQGQLSKVNTATLTSWLKDHCVPCKVRDKKSDLVDKVKFYLRISNPEQ